MIEFLESRQLRSATLTGDAASATTAAFEPTFTGDKTDDVIVAAGPGGGPHVRVFDGTTDSQPTFDFYAYDPAFRGGVNVANSGGGSDVDGDGRDDIITGAGSGASPHVK